MDVNGVTPARDPNHLRRLKSLFLLGLFIDSYETCKLYVVFLKVHVTEYRKLQAYLGVREHKHRHAQARFLSLALRINCKVLFSEALIGK